LSSTDSTAVRRHQFTGPGGIKLSADIAGAAGHATVVLLHGGGQTRHSWGGATRALARAGYRVINLDVRGHGESGWSPEGDYSIHARSQDLLAVLSSIEAPCALVGASMGGTAALYATRIAAHAHLKALILVDIVAKPSPHGVKRIQDFMRRHLDGFATVEEAIAAVAAYNPTRRRDPDPIGMRKNLRAGPNGRLIWHWDPNILSLDAWTETAALMAVLEQTTPPALPTLLVRGLRSDVVADDGIADLREKIPGLEVVNVAGAGHMVAGDKNDAFNAGVLQFLKQHLPP